MSHTSQRILCVLCVGTCMVIAEVLLWCFVLDTNVSRRIVRRRIQEYAELARKHPERIEYPNKLLAMAKSDWDFQACSATSALGRIGTSAVPVMPEIAELMDSSNLCVSQEAAKALTRLGRLSEAVLPQIRERIKREPSDATTWFALQALGEIGPPAAECLPLLRQKQDSVPAAFEGSVQLAIEKIEGERAHDSPR